MGVHLVLPDPITAELRTLEARALTVLGEFTRASEALTEVRKRAERLRRSHSNSFFGDHTFTYLHDFEPPTQGFDVEWGHLEGFEGEHNAGWTVYRMEELLDFVYGATSFEAVDAQNRRLETAAQEIRDRALDLLCLIEESADSTATIRKISTEACESIRSAFEDASEQRYIEVVLKNGPGMTRDSKAFSQGVRVPVHECALAQLQFLEKTGKALLLVGSVTRRVLLAAALAAPASGAQLTQGKVFIGHGRSPVWRELKEYLETELGLTTEEFNSEPVAGLTTQSRLDETLARASMAFLVMTAEDAAVDGSMRARDNVIHEVGLFQGRLGWTKAIVLLENGCSEFSNLHGVNHIRFGRSRIKDAFVEVRRALAREGLASK